MHPDELHNDSSNKRHIKTCKYLVNPRNLARFALARLEIAQRKSWSIIEKSLEVIINRGISIPISAVIRKTKFGVSQFVFREYDTRGIPRSTMY